MFKKFQVGILPMLIIYVSLVSAQTVYSANYFIDATSGNNNNNGTSTTTPWQTLTKVNATTFSPGDNILFKRGETFAGNLVVGQSGTSGSPITFGAYGEGAYPIINATGTSHGVDIRTNKSYITIQSLEVRNATANIFLLFPNGASNTVSNIIINDVIAYGGNNASFNLLGSGTISDVTISSSTALAYSGADMAVVRMVGATSTNITIDGVTATTTTGRYGVLTGANIYSNILITNSTFNNHTQYGALFSTGTTTGMTIRNSTFSSNGIGGIYVTGSLTNFLLDNVTASENVTGSGLQISSSLSYASVSSSTVQNSEFNDNGVNGISLAGSGTGTNIFVYQTETSGNDNDGNNIHNSWTNVIFDTVTANDNGVNGLGADGDGFSYHETSTGIIRNSIAHNNKKSAVTNIDTASTTIYNNLFSHDTSGTNALGRFYDSGTNTLYNNVFYSPSQTGTGLSVEETATLIAKNNIIYGFDTGVQKLNTASFTEDYNLVFGAGTANWSGITQGANSISSDPQFTDAADGDYTLQDGSPAVNAGTDTLCSATDRAGRSRSDGCDIGAYEGDEIVVSNDESNNNDESISGYIYRANKTEPLTSIVENILKQIEVLQAEIARRLASQEVNVDLLQGFTFINDLTIGAVGSDVKKLQEFLNENDYLINPEVGGAGYPGNETEYFGNLTREALIRFQYENNIEPAVGFFGPITRGLVNSMLKI